MLFLGESSVQRNEYGLLDNPLNSLGIEFWHVEIQQCGGNTRPEESPEILRSVVERFDNFDFPGLSSKE